MCQTFVIDCGLVENTKLNRNALDPKLRIAIQIFLSTQNLQKLTSYFSLLSRPSVTLLLKLEIFANHSNSLTMLHWEKESEGNTEVNLQSPRRSQQQLQDFEGSAEFNLASPQRSTKKLQFPRFSISSPRTKVEQYAHPPLRSQQQLQDFEGSAEFNLASPKRPPKKMQSPRFSISSPRTKVERHAHPPLPSRSLERGSSFKAALKTLVSPVKKAGNMLSDSFQNLNSPKVYEEEEDEDGEAEEFKKENNDLTLMLLCRELELLSD
jgi:truncated hemoglobin YjbI